MSEEQKHAKMRDMVMTWDEISDELIWGDYDVSGPEIQKISDARLEEFCKRFPHFAERLRSFCDDWNKDDRLTQEMMAAIEHTEVTQEELDRSWRRTKMMPDFYRKLRTVEAERDTYKAMAEARGESATALRKVLEQVNIACCYASEENTEARGETLLHIGTIVRAALAGAKS